MIINFKVGDQAGKNNDPGNSDFILNQLLEEIGSREAFLDESRAYLDGEPEGEMFEPDEEQEFNGIETLRSMSVTNYAELIVSATTDRLGILGFRTAIGSGETGDPEASVVFQENEMQSKLQEALSWACGYRSAYLSVNPKTGTQSVVPPTNGAVVNDVAGNPVAAVVMHRNLALGNDILDFYVRQIDGEGLGAGGVVQLTAHREIPSFYSSGLKITENDQEVPLSSRVKSDWEWWKRTDHKLERIPVTALRNKGGISEFEKHVSVINRINHMLFQRVIIATFQAFKQRIMSGTFPRVNKDGTEVDYNDIFRAGPARIWLAPPDTKIWESSPTSFQDILESVKADERALASVTKTPSSYFSDSANQSAEGASFAREGYLSKIEDRRKRFGDRLRRHISIVFEVRGDTDRSPVEDIGIIWDSSKPESLTDRSAAYASLTQNKVPSRSAARIALNLSPEEISLIESERIQERLEKAIEAQLDDLNTPLENNGITAQTQVSSSTNQALRESGVDNRSKQ